MSKKKALIAVGAIFIVAIIGLMFIFANKNNDENVVINNTKNEDISTETLAEDKLNLVEIGNDMSTVYSIFSMFDYQINITDTNKMEVDFDDNSKLILEFDDTGLLNNRYVE